MAKNKEPIGQEVSINSEVVPSLLDAKTGDKCTLYIRATKLGEHVHSLPNNKEHMVDIRIDDISYEEEDEDTNDDKE